MQTWANVTIGNEFNRLFDVVNHYAAWSPLFGGPMAQQMRGELARLFLIGNRQALFDLGVAIEQRARAAQMGLDFD